MIFFSFVILSLGLDDYNKQRDKITKEKNIISKNKNDYPSLKVRKKILDRFTGFFGTFERKQQEEAINRDNHYVYEFAKESPEGVKAILRGQAFSNLKVSAKE